MISKQQFILLQPAAPDETETDSFYLALANRLIKIAEERHLFCSYPAKVMERTALSVIGYYQDVICDAGIWRSFILENRRLYGYTLPFYDKKDWEYMDFELNKIDVRFMVWYSLSMNYADKRITYPFDEEIITGADVWFEELDRVYDEAPIPVDYRLTHELEIHAQEDSEAILTLGNWLFMHCYLMTPAYALTLSEIASGIDLSKENGIRVLQNRLEQSMIEDPIGPLALYLREWLYLVVDGKYPQVSVKSEIRPEHKYYTAFTRATGGEVLKFFDSYGEMNKFFIEALGWEKNEEHLPQMKNERDFILMVDREKGMLLARNIARCIAHPANPYYDKVYASSHAIELLTERGRCPGDLLKYVCSNGWLRDAVFPNSDNHMLVAENWDFIARCYLQRYYRGD